MNLARAALVTLMIVVAVADILDFEEKTNELCYTCSCSSDGATVDCSRRGLVDIPDGVSHKVKKLNMSHNEISTFPDNIGKFYNLVSIDMSDNKLSELLETALQNLTALEVLDLSENNFESWVSLNPNNVLQPAAKLKILNLSNNNFKTMANLADKELLISPTLDTLILEHCGISSIQGRSPFSGLISLRVLKLNFNPLKRILNVVSPTLKSLSASHCEFNFLYNIELSYLPSLLYLQLSFNYRLDLSASYTTFSNSLRYLDISNCYIMRPRLQGFPNLRRAIISHNVIGYLVNNEFINNTRLEHLDLSFNNIGSLKTDTFRGLSMLKQLDLSSNRIGEMSEDSLLKMPSLTQINLSKNYITRIEYLRSSSLKIVDMSSCEISIIRKDSLEGLQSLIDLDLSHNLLSHIPDNLSSRTLRYLNFNYNRLSSVNNFTFSMLPRLTGLGVEGNRFTAVWDKSYFVSNPYLERLDLLDNMWRCDCSNTNMLDFYEFVTLEPNKKEESNNLICNSPIDVIGQTWLEACYFMWNPMEKKSNSETVMWFIITMIVGLSMTLVIVNVIRKSMKRRLEAIQAERERQVEEARDRLRQLRMRAEQEALCNAPDPRDLIAPPSYDEALSMPKLNMSTHSLNETGTGKSKRRRGRRKTKSSGDLLEEAERNGDVSVEDDRELTEASDDNHRRKRRRRNRRYGSHEVVDLEQSPGARRRRLSAYDPGSDSVTVEVEAELERPLRPRNRRYSSDDDDMRESDL